MPSKTRKKRIRIRKPAVKGRLEIRDREAALSLAQHNDAKHGYYPRGTIPTKPITLSPGVGAILSGWRVESSLHL